MEPDPTSEIYFARSRAVASRILNGEVVVMSPTDSTLFTLSEIATIIWEAADGRTPLSAIVRDRICTEFDVKPDVAYRDAEVFVQDLASHGILRLSSQPIAADEPDAGSAPDPSSDGTA